MDGWLTRFQLFPRDGDMDGWVAAEYTAEQQQRRGVNEIGEPTKAAPESAESAEQHIAVRPTRIYGPRDKCVPV